MNGDRLPLPVRLVADTPVRIENAMIGGAGGPLAVRLYRPQGIANPPALVLVHGLYYMGMDAPDLVSYARRMAACGILVMTPDLLQLRRDRIDGSSIDNIGEATRWLAAQNHMPVGLIATSFSGALSLLAAERPENQSSIKFVFVSGTYDSLPRLIRAYGTHRELLPDGKSVPTDGRQYGPRAVEYAYAERAIPPADRPAILAVLEAELQRHTKAALKLQSGLSSTQERELETLESGETLLQVANDMGPELNQLSPYHHLTSFRVPVFLLHGSDDPVIPPGEAEWLARDLPPGTLKAKLISPVFSHAGIGTESHTWKDRWQLVHFFAQVLKAAETDPKIKD